MKEAITKALEGLRQAEEQHPGWPDDIFEGLAIVGEEYGELQQAVLDKKYKNGDYAHVEKEAIHTAAMALRFLINLDDTYHPYKKTDAYKRCKDCRGD